MLCARTRSAIATLDDSVADLFHQWPKASHQAPPTRQQNAFPQRIDAGDQPTQTFPDGAAPLTWEAIALAGAAKVESGKWKVESGLGKVKQARKLLQSAEMLNPDAPDGYISSTLGSLHAKVPGSPVGYGNKVKARQYMNKALAVNPEGLDPNVLYGEFLARQGDYAAALQHVQHALAAPRRPGREDSDMGRRQEVTHPMDALRKEHPVP